MRSRLGYNVGMHGRLLLLAFCLGCGSVAALPDGGGNGSQDGQVPTDLLDGTLRNGCVVALHMDEPSWSGVAGEVKDDCGGDNPGKVTGAGTTTVAGGVRGRAGSFTGGGCIDIADAAALHGATGLTMSAWIFATQLNNGENANGVISKRTDFNSQAEYSLMVWMRNHTWVDLDTDRIEGNGVIATNIWTQLTAVYDATQPIDQRARVFINGSLDVKGGMRDTLTPFTSVLHVGCMPAPSSMTQQNFFGELDEVVIWNRALSDAEVLRWYNNTKPQ